MVVVDHMLLPEPVTEAREMGCLGQPGLGHVFSGLGAQVGGEGGGSSVAEARRLRLGEVQFPQRKLHVAINSAVDARQAVRADNLPTGRQGF